MDNMIYCVIKVSHLNMLECKNELEMLYYLQRIGLPLKGVIYPTLDEDNFDYEFYDDYVKMEKVFLYKPKIN